MRCNVKVFSSCTSLYSSGRVLKSLSMPSPSHFTILYGSQTGQAQAIAEEIHENSSENGLQSKLFCLSATDKKFSIEKEPLLVFVVSTTGEGDPPDTMLKFMRRIKKKTLPTDYLKDCKYTLLALGDTNYTNFCNNGKNLDRRLLSLGAKQFYNTGYADDAVGLEVVVDPWIQGLWDAIKKHLELNNDVKISNGTHQVLLDGKPDVEAKDFNDDENLSKLQKLKQHENGLGSEEQRNTEMCNSEMEDKDKTKSCIPEEMNNEVIKEPNKVPIVGVEGNTETSSVNNQETRNIEYDSEKEAKSDSILLKPSLKIPSKQLSSIALSIPLLQPSYLLVQFQDDSLQSEAGIYDTALNRDFCKATILSSTTLTSKNALKTALEIELDISETGIVYQPGDSFDILCPNSQEEVSELIAILGLKEKADVPFKIEIIENTTKKLAIKPSHLPELCTIRNAFLNFLEIRTVPKKAMLRMLVEYTMNPQEKRRLQELCSKQGASEYQSFIRQPSASLLEILKAFPSCCPPFERLLEHLPRLTPRPYSIASSPLTDHNKLKFVFNIVEFPPYEEVRSNRIGVCTGWLSCATESMRKVTSLEDRLTSLDIQEKETTPKVFVAPRKLNKFHLPTDGKLPIIMIGPGTGVAPFIGFLEQRKLEAKNRNEDGLFGSSWLFYGCRNKDHDYLFKQQLQDYLSSGVLSKLSVCFSREEGSAVRYVQDSLKLHSKDVANIVFNEGGVVYVCGDAKNMAKDVFAVFCEIAENHFGISKAESIKQIGKLRANNQYHEDVWT